MEERTGLKEALQFIADLGIQSRAPQVAEINGKKYSREALREYGAAPLAEPIRATTLTALVDYITHSGATEMPSDMILQIKSPTHVELYSALNDERKRETLFEVDAMLPGFRYDTEYDQERFVVAVQACIEDTDDRKAILMFASNVVNQKTAEFSDDGVTQQAVIKTGLTQKELAIVPSPARLRPFRTFTELAQPESEFVFRMSEGRNGQPTFKLIEADGGRWKIEAMQSIKAYFEEALSDLIGIGRIIILA